MARRSCFITFGNALIEKRKFSCGLCGFFFQAEDGIRDSSVTGVQTCALPISHGFFHNRNDVDEAMREAGAAPLFSYLLGFSPQNLKIGGRFHTLKVALTSKGKLDRKSVV